jgi:carbonic anhydrase/acetyltransferase-like protein (isoleucine patch superfamily)
VVLNRARIGRRSMVGAGSLVTEGKEFPDDSLLMGSPAKVVRALSAEQAERVRLSAVHYTEKAMRHHRGLRRIG